MNRHHFSGVKIHGRLLAALVALCWMTFAVACAPPTGEGVEATGEKASGGSILSRVFGPKTEKRTLPAGSRLTVRFDDTLSSHQSQVGDAFTVTVVQELSSEGVTLVPVGSRIHGHVRDVRVPDSVGGRARLVIELDRLELSDGQSLPIAAQVARSGKSETLKDAGIIAGGTLGGIVLGEAIDEGEGGVIGGIVGGLAGAYGATKTKGRPVVIADGTTMTVELTQPVEIEVQVT